jgi:hypothetical protein
MERANLIEFDDVALVHDEALLNTEDDEILNVDGSSSPSSTASSILVDQPCSSPSVLPLSVLDEAVVFDDPESSPSSTPLPPARSIRPPRLPPQTTHLPPPEVSSADEPDDLFARWHRRNGRLCLGVGISQIIVGAVCVALAIASFVTRVNFYMVNHGMWGGITVRFG